MASLEQQLKKLEKLLQPKIRKVIETHVQEKVKDEMIEAIQTEVYNGYDSKAKNPYPRRYERGGLIDRSNIQGTWQGDVFAMRNMTKGRDQDIYIDEVIIGGTGYTWIGSEIYKMQPYPRDFIEETIKRLERNKAHIEAFKSGMKSLGIDVR